MERRLKITLYLVICAFAVLIFRLWDLQLIKGTEYKQIDERNRLRVLDIPAPRGIIYDRNNRALVRNIPSFDISIIREYIPEDDESLSALGKVIGLELDDIRERLEKAPDIPFKPVKLKHDVTFAMVAKVEARKLDFPGLQIDVVNGREYLYGHSASHLIGYLGRISVKQLSLPEYSNVPRESFIGQFGMEKIHDDVLLGRAGKKVIEVNAVGNIIKVVRIQRPVKGQDITLTIDISLQLEAEKSLAGKAGAVVAVKADTGEVLALASAPSFDPNLFVRGIKYRDWKKLAEDPRKPLLNRAIQSHYPPGSTFKIITALAALEEGLIGRNTIYNCSGSTYFGRVFRCWKDSGHGRTDIYKALTESCDVYFYEVAKILDVDILAKYAKAYGLGSRTGIGLEGESAGIVPSSGWKFRTRGEKWYKGETLNTVIGQGYLSVTPIQMACATAAVVNGGKLYRPYLLKDREGTAKLEREIGVQEKNIRIIKKALLGVVEGKHGTGRLANSDMVRIGGKTGTTQVIGGDPEMEDEDIPRKYRDHAWFVAFAPDDNPAIAVAVFVEHGEHGSTGAAPIAKRIIEAYYGKQKS